MSAKFEYQCDRCGIKSEAVWNGTKERYVKPDQWGVLDLPGYADRHLCRTCAIECITPLPRVASNLDSEKQE